ncbi:hypothetical protein ACTXT7_006284 [Hymenolepis weldensis]
MPNAWESSLSVRVKDESHGHNGLNGVSVRLNDFSSGVYKERTSESQRIGFAKYCVLELEPRRYALLIPSFPFSLRRHSHNPNQNYHPANAKQVYDEKEGEISLNPRKNYIPRVTSTTTKRIDQNKSKDNLPNGRLLCPVEECYKNDVKNKMAAKLHEIFRILRMEKKMMKRKTSLTELQTIDLMIPEIG